MNTDKKQTDRQKDRQTDRQTDSQRGTNEKIQIERTDMNVVRWTKRTTSRQIEMESYARQAIRLRDIFFI